MKRHQRSTDIRDYTRRPSMSEEDRLEAVDIIERHFPDIIPGNVYRVTVEQESGYAIVNVYQYAQKSTTDLRRYIDEKTGEVAVLPIVTKTFPVSGLLSP